MGAAVGPPARENRGEAVARSGRRVLRSIEVFMMMSCWMLWV
jgi:hypothetical protein